MLLPYFLISFPHLVLRPIYILLLRKSMNKAESPDVSEKKASPMPWKAHAMSHRIAKAVTVGWLLIRWQTLLRFAGKIRAVGLMVLLLFPACLIANDSHACALHRFPSSDSVYFSPIIGDDQADHPECLACQWKVIADAETPILTPPKSLLSLPSWTIEEHPRPLYLYLSCQERAPPIFPPTLLFE